MKTFALFGINASSAPVKLGKDVRAFIDKDHNFDITFLTNGSIQLVTNKGKYILPQHPVMNYYHATLNGCPVQIHIKAVSGWLKFGKQNK